MNSGQKKNGIIHQNLKKAEGLDPDFCQTRYQGSKAKIELLRVFYLCKTKHSPKQLNFLYIWHDFFFQSREQILTDLMKIASQFSCFPTDSVCYIFLNTNNIFLWSQILETMCIFFFETIRWYSWHERLQKPKIFHPCWLCKWLNITAEIMARPGVLAARHLRIKPHSINTENNNAIAQTLFQKHVN